MTDPQPSPQRQTATALVEAFNAKDTDKILSFRSEDCMRIFHPASLNFPSQTNAAYLANLTAMNAIFTSFHLVVDDIVEDLPARKICMWVTARGDTPVGEYNNEYVWKMGFDESGEKIVEWHEFVDVGVARDFLPKLRGLRRGRGEGEGSKD